MKTILMTLLTLTIVHTASAESIRQPDLTAQLTKIDFDKLSSYNQSKVDGGSVRVDLTQGQIEVTVYRKFYCPPNAMCAMVMPAPIELTARNLVVTTTECNEIVYTAEVDERPVDGIYSQIKVTDFTRSVCQYYIAVPETAITVNQKYYNRRNGNPVDLTHTFEAKALQ